jgi:hypothetical protein
MKWPRNILERSPDRRDFLAGKVQRCPRLAAQLEKQASEAPKLAVGRRAVQIQHTQRSS